MAQAQTSKPTAPAVVPPADVKGAHRNVFEGADLSHYVKGAAKTASGNKTHDSGDEVAAKYPGLDPSSSSYWQAAYVSGGECNDYYILGMGDVDAALGLCQEDFAERIAEGLVEFRSVGELLQPVERVIVAL